MNYCENCHVACREERCPLCSGKKLRPVNDNDYCLVAERKNVFYDGLLAVLDGSQIPYNTLPYGSGVESQLGIPLKNYRLFVPYSYFEEVKEIIRDVEQEETDELRKPVLDNLDNLNILPKLEKKIRRKAKLDDQIDIFDYCIDIIKNAEKIVDGGLDGENLKSGGHRLFCFCGNKILIVNSKTFEITYFRIQK